MFLFRFLAWFLFRYAARSLLASSIQEPPRTTRRAALSGGALSP